MAKLPVAGHNSTSDHLQTWILRVYIHCEGCKKKVFKVLQSIDGVYKTEINSLQHKAIVTGSVDGATLVQKLLKSGKHAEVLPESFEATAAADCASGKSKKKKIKQNKQKDDETADTAKQRVDEEKEESEGSDGAKDQDIPQPVVPAGDGNGGGGGGKKKNKKKKGDKKDNNAPPNGDNEGLPAGNALADTGSIPVMAENVGASMEQLNLSHPGHQMVYATPYDVPPYQNYYPTPAYGVSYSTSYPSAESSYYTPPVYGYAQSHTSFYYPPPPPPSSYPRSAFDDHDDEKGSGKSCTIM